MFVICRCSSPAEFLLELPIRFTCFFLDMSFWCPTGIFQWNPTLLFPLPPPHLLSIFPQWMHQPPPYPTQKPVIQNSYLPDTSQACCTRPSAALLDTISFDSSFRCSQNCHPSSPSALVHVFMISTWYLRTWCLVFQLQDITSTPPAILILLITNHYTAYLKSIILSLLEAKVQTL